MKKWMILFLTAILSMNSVISLYAEGEDQPDYSDTTYWNNLCLGNAAYDNSAACTAYMQYISSQSESFANQMKEIDAKKDEIAANIEYYGQQIQTYQNQADALNDEIATLNGQIAVKEQEIATKEEEIAKNEEEVAAAKEKIKERMVSAQETMRLNKFLDILMGAKSFNDFIRIANGLSDITNYDESTMQELSDLIEKLDNDKAQLEEEKTELDASKQEVVNKQNEILAAKYQIQVIQNEFQKQFSDLQAQYANMAANIDSIKKTMTDIAEHLNDVPTAAGWTYPVPAGHKNQYAGTWAYGSGARHLGCDYVGTKGTPVVAAGNGVIINSVNGCGDGWLGNGCVGTGGVWGGGNQIYALYKMNDGLYAVQYSHLLLNSPIAVGTVVTGGQQIGQLGTSGNSTGPHCHIEVYYVAPAGTSLSTYLSNWNGDLSFGTKWGAAAMSHICENGDSIPCRVRPEAVFGNN